MSLKQLAEQMLLTGSAGSLPLFVPDEQPRQKLVLRHRPLVFVSPDNPGAAAVADDLRRGMSNAFEVTSAAAALPMQLEEGKHRAAGGASHFLLYLNDQTYLGEAPPAGRCLPSSSCVGRAAAALVTSKALLIPRRRSSATAAAPGLSGDTKTSGF